MPARRSYAARLLIDAYGFDPADEGIEFLGDVGGTEVEWTLGALLNEILHAPPPPPSPLRAATVPIKFAPSGLLDLLHAFALLGVGGAILCYFSGRGEDVFRGKRGSYEGVKRLDV